MKKNVAGQIIGAQMISASDGSAFTGSVTVSVTGDGGTQATGSVGSGACTHEGNGFHTYAPAQAETNYDHVAFTFTGTGAIPVTIQVYPSFPQTGDSFARLGAPTGASIAADLVAIDDYLDTEVAAILAAVDTEVGAIKTVTDALSPRLPVSGTLSTLDASGVRSAVGLASANLDTQLTTIAGYIDTEIASILTAVDTEVAAIKAKTDSLTFSTAGRVDAQVFGMEASVVTAAAIATGAIDADALAADAGNEIADAILARDLGSGTGAGSSEERTVRSALRFLRNKWSISGVTMTVTKEDDSTAAWTTTLATSGTAEPVISSDPT